jgi:hypothetical protein
MGVVLYSEVQFTIFIDTAGRSDPDQDQELLPLLPMHSESIDSAVGRRVMAETNVSGKKKFEGARLSPGRRETEQVRQDTTRETPILQYVLGALPTFRRGSPGNRILLLMIFRDFDCHACLNDFTRLSQEAKKITDGNNVPRMAALFKKSPQADPDRRSEFDRWISANDIQCPCYILPDSIYNSVGFEKSTIIVLDSLNQILYSRQFPLGDYYRSEALDIFHRER